MGFTTPDGKEFETKKEWRDYMYATFYSFKNKVDEPQPLIKEPGSIDGQMFDMAECTNSTLVLMDHTEQIQIDELKNCRVFIGACASSLFIRNCSNCTFYTCCRQLRLRDIVDCNFYIYSMSEVHIEYSSRVAFAPFNGGYPDHAKHMVSAKLDISHNLWYDIFDHNDPAKTREHWSLIPEADRETDGWFPAGPCERAIPLTTIGSVQRKDQDGGMQSFGADQLMKDAVKSPIAPSTGPVAVGAPAAAVPMAPVTTEQTPPVPPPAASQSEEPNPRIGIIGTGNVGVTLAGRFLAAGWPVCFGSEHPSSEKTKAAVAKLGDDTILITSMDQAALASDILLLAIPGMRCKESCQHFVATLGSGAAGKIVIDATNPLSEFPGLEVLWDGHTSGGEIIQAALPDSLVYKAFNTTGSEHMAHPDGSQIPGYNFSQRGPLKMLFCGPVEHHHVAAEVIAAVGFSPQYIGPIRYARNLEAIAELWVHLAVPPAGSTSVDWGRTFHFEPTGR